jgi:two-component system, chemotaxis family, protein-glutamate methylesterase/glutaminase
MEEDKMTDRMIIIGGSAGSLHALLHMLSLLNRNFPFPILLVLHRHNAGDSTLVELLRSRSDLEAKEVEEKDTIQPGTIYVCPADYHVLIESDESFSLDASEKVHFSRPSLDVVFQSAADVFDKRLVGIVLSGANADGAAGLQYIKQRGGLTIVQDPADAQVPYMPEQVLHLFTPDQILSAGKIAGFLNLLAG